MVVVVYDIGGTNLRSAFFQEEMITDIRRYKTPNYFCMEEDEIKQSIFSIICNDFTDRLNSVRRIDGIAICFPGPVSASGNILGSSVIFGKTLKSTFNLKELIEDEFPQAKVLVTNDITAAAYRYIERNDFCLVTVSSGIGNKICIGGKIIVDKNGKTGEIGHFAYSGYNTEIECSCGTGKNHVGMFSSGRGIEFFANKLFTYDRDYMDSFANSPLKLTVDSNRLILAEQVAKEADRGDDYAKKVIDFCTVPLAEVIALLSISLYIPEFIIIGGFALNCSYYRKSLVKNIIKKGIYNFSNTDIERMISYGINDDNHGLIGLGKLFHIVFRK